MTCKPGSVQGLLPSAIIPLGRPLLDGSRNLPERSGAVMPCSCRQKRAVPIWSCSGRGLPCRSRYRERGALLPHPFTLTLASQGGLLSVALSLGLPPAGVTRRPITVEPGLSSGAPKDVPRSPGHLAHEAFARNCLRNQAFGSMKGAMTSASQPRMVMPPPIGARPGRITPVVA